MEKRLKFAMLASNMSAAALSRRTGIPKSSLSKYLNGKTFPNLKHACMISEVLDVDLVWLITGKNKKEATNGCHLVPFYTSNSGDKEYFPVFENYLCVVENEGNYYGVKISCDFTISKTLLGKRTKAKLTPDPKEKRE